MGDGSKWRIPIFIRIGNFKDKGHGCVSNGTTRHDVVNGRIMEAEGHKESQSEV